MTGQRFGHFEVLSRLGSGGMGVVYLARDLHLPRLVAVKVLSEGSVADEHARSRFRREADALSRLNHPHIATIFDFDQQDGCDFLVMEYIEGQSLRDAGPLPLPRADVVDLGIALARALTAAHDAGVVHLDLKPGNLMRTKDGRLKVLDFGIARLQQAEAFDATLQTVTIGVAQGTPPYMAPEQVMVADVDGRTDIYGAGATLYELATGHRVFPQPRGPELFNAILLDAPVPPSRHNPAVDPSLDAVLLKSLAKNPPDRQQSASELCRELELCAETSPDVRHRGAGRRRLTRREAILAGATTVIAVAAMGYYALTPGPAGAVYHPPDLVLMADVENRTDDSLLARQVQESLTLALQQSRLTSIVSRERVGEALERMKRARDGAVDERTALEICQREGIPAVLSVSAARSGRATKITVKALQAEGASLLFAESVDYDEAAGFFRPIDDLAKRVRLRLGESLSEIQLNLKSLAQATTSSTEALRQYTRALDARAMGRSDEIEAPLLAALRLDPDFAMAHLKLADYYGNVAGDTLKALPELDAAYRLRDRVPPREQSLITAEYFENHAQLEKSRETLKILATLYPKDPEVRYALALRHYNLEELKSAIAEVREAVRLDPHAVRPYGGLVLFLARDNQAQAALAAAGDALAAGLDSPQLRWAYGLALLGVDKVAEARVEFAGFSQGSGYEAHLAQLQLARASLYEGNLRDASDWFTRLLEDAHRTGERSFERVARVQLARTAALMGDRALVRQQSVKLEALSKGTPMPPVDLLESGHVALVAGYRAIVQAQLARLRAQEKSNATPLVRAARLLLESEVAFADRHFALAAQLQNEALVLRPWAMYSRTRAEALERLGDWPAASKAWQVILDARGQILQDGFPPDLAAAREGLARAGARVQQPVRKEP